MGKAKNIHHTLFFGVNGSITTTKLKEEASQNLLLAHFDISDIPKEHLEKTYKKNIHGFTEFTKKILKLIDAKETGEAILVFFQMPHLIRGEKGISLFRRILKGPDAAEGCLHHNALENVIDIGNIKLLNLILDVLGQRIKEACRINDFKGPTPFHKAAAKGLLVIFETLIDQFKDNEVKINICMKKDRDEKTVLHYAARSGNLQLLNFIIKILGNDKSLEICLQPVLYQYSIIFDAIESGNPQVLNRIIEIIRDHAPRVCQLVSQFGDTVLSNAIEKGPQIVGIILNILDEEARKICFADSKIFSLKEKTVLHLAVESGNIETFMLIVDDLENNGYLDKVRLREILTSPKYEPLLHIAIARNSYQIVSWIFDRFPEHAIDLCLMKNNRNQSALHHAAKLTNPDIFLLIYKILGQQTVLDICLEKDNDGYNPFHYAISSKNIEAFNLIIYLLDDETLLKQCLEECGGYKHTSLHLAASVGNVIALQYFIKLLTSERVIKTKTAQEFLEESNSLNLAQSAFLIQDKGGHRPYYDAFCSQNLESIKLTISLLTPEQAVETCLEKPLLNDTFFHNACFYGDKKLMQYIIGILGEDRIIKLCFDKEDSTSPLIMLAQSNKVEAFSYLFEFLIKKDVDTKRRVLQQLKDCSLENINPQVVNCIRKWLSEQESSLYFACYDGDRESIQNTIELLGGVHVIEQCFAEDKSMPLLIILAQSGKFEAFSYLFEFLINKDSATSKKVYDQLKECSLNNIDRQIKEYIVNWLNEQESTLSFTKR